MKYFLVGLAIGLFWRDIKWLTYDLLKAIFKGTHNAIRVCCFGELMPGASRCKVLIKLPKIIWYEAGAYLKWEWLHGCRLTRG